MRWSIAVLLAATLAAGAASADENPWFAAGREAVQRARGLRPDERPAKNVILFLGDGMGLSTVTAARILEGQLRGERGEENWLAFERLPHVSLVKTYNTNQQTPDSAGTMTAIVTGSKTRAGVIGVDERVARGDAAGVAGHELRTLFETAEQRGVSTGIVTTTRVSHATPAGVYGHSPERGWEDDASLSEAARDIDFPDLTRQLVEWPYGDGLDVVLGGGRRTFLPRRSKDPEQPGVTGSRRDGRDLIAEWLARRPGSVYVWNRAGFDAVPESTSRLLGLFEPDHMKFEHDRSGDIAGEPSLAEMTSKAIGILSRNPKGFLLLVEGGRIDHAHHLGNAYRALTDTIAFSDAVRAALERTDPDETLIVVTADHGHVLSIAGYPTRGNPILGQVVSNDERGEPQAVPAPDDNGRPYTTLGYQNGPGWQEPRPDAGPVDTTAPDYRQAAAVYMRAETHSGEDVPVYAGGPGSYLFQGVQEQSYLYHALVEALGWGREAPPESKGGEPAASSSGPAPERSDR